MSKEIFLTREGYEKLKKELDSLRGRKRKEISEALEKARLMGDLSENAEYDSAKDMQAINEAKINELTEKIVRARILEDEKIVIAKDKVYIGSKVQLCDIASDAKVFYILVAQDEADFDQGKLSIDSPVARALLGKKKGETVKIQVPAGILKYKIIDISR